jgi:hypothetical protein
LAVCGENVLLCLEVHGLRVAVGGYGLGQVDAPRRLGKDELYRCPFPHVYPKHKQALSEKRKLTEEDLQNISLKAWLEAIKQCTGKPIQVVISKK